MFVFNGPLPALIGRLARLPHPRWASQAVVLVSALALFTPCHAVAAPIPATTPLSLAEAERQALADEPGRQALDARSEALSAEAKAAGALPKPVLRIGLNNYPIESGDFSTEGMTNAGVSWRQAFPPGDVRRLSQERLDWASTAAQRESLARDRQVRLGVREAWLRLFLGQHEEALLAASQPLFSDLLAVTRSLYAVGRKNQQDVLRAELELGRLQDRLLEARQIQSRSRAELERWTGDFAGRPLPEALPALPAVPGLPRLREGLARHPRLWAADALLEARGRAVHLAEEQGRPGWALDVGYAYRDGTLPDGQPRSDFITVGVSFDLPFLRRQALDSELQAALAAEDALQFEREALRRNLEGELNVQYAHWIELGERIELYENHILRQAAAHAEAAKLAYQADTADFADVMRAAIDELDARLELLRLQVNRAQSQATLAFLGGLDHES